MATPHCNQEVQYNTQPLVLHTRALNQVFFCLVSYMLKCVNLKGCLDLGILCFNLLHGTCHIKDGFTAWVAVKHLCPKFTAGVRKKGEEKTMSIPGKCQPIYRYPHPVLFVFVDCKDCRGEEAMCLTSEHV